MIWRNVIPKLFFAFLPTLIIPGIIIWQIVKHFGISETSLLGIMALAQVYIVWAQLEISLRQSALAAREYEPIFKIGKKYIGWGNYFYYIENVGKYLARNVNLLIQILENKENIKVHEFKQMIGDIVPGEKITLGNFQDWEDKYIITLDVNYEDILDRMDSTYFVKEPKFKEFLNILPRKKLPGILLNSFEEIGLIFSGIYFIHLRKFLRKSAHEKNKIVLEKRTFNHHFIEESQKNDPKI